MNFRNAQEKIDLALPFWTAPAPGEKAEVLAAWVEYRTERDALAKLNEELVDVLKNLTLEFNWLLLKSNIRKEIEDIIAKASSLKKGE